MQFNTHQLDFHDAGLCFIMLHSNHTRDLDPYLEVAFEDVRNCMST